MGSSMSYHSGQPVHAAESRNTHVVAASVAPAKVDTPCSVRTVTMFLKLLRVR